MPRRKPGPTLAAPKKKDCNAKQNIKKLLKGKPNVSIERNPKPRLNSNTWNYVTHTGYLSAPKENGNEKEEEDGSKFGLNPAYLCECSLQTQDTPEIQEDLLKDNGTKNSVFKTTQLKRKRDDIHSKAIKHSNVNSLNQELNPAFLCESILQIEDTSGVTGSSNPFNYNNSSPGNQLLKRKKRQPNIQGNVIHLEFNYQSKQNISKTSVPNPLNACNSKNRLSQNIPQKRRRLQQNGKEPYSNEENQIQEFNPAFLCESVLFEENVLVSKSDSLKLSISTNSLAGKKARKSKLPVQQKPNIKLKKSEINCKDQTNSLRNFSENKIQSICVPEVSESQLLQSNCSAITLFSSNLANRNKSQFKNRKVKNGKQNCTTQKTISANPRNTTVQCENSSEISQCLSSKENSVLMVNDCNKAKQHRTNDRINNKLQETSSESVSKSTIQNEGTSKTLKSPLPKQSCLEKEFSEIHPQKKKRPKRRKKKLKKKVTNKTYKDSLVNPTKSTIKIPDSSVVPEPVLSNEYPSENQLGLLKNHQSELEKPQRTSRRQRSNITVNKAQEHSSLNFSNSTLQCEESSEPGKSNLEEQGNKVLSCKTPLQSGNIEVNNEKALPNHSLNEICNDYQEKHTEKINFIECSLLAHGPKHRDNLCHIGGISDTDLTAVDKDPLELNSMDELGSHPKDVDGSESKTLKIHMTRKRDHSPEIGPLKCDLLLECTLEDNELDPALQDSGCDYEETNVLGSTPPSLDIAITQSLEASPSECEVICGLESMLTFQCGSKFNVEDSIKIEIKPPKNDDDFKLLKSYKINSFTINQEEISEIEIQQVKNMDEIKLLENNDKIIKPTKIENECNSNSETKHFKVVETIEPQGNNSEDNHSTEFNITCNENKVGDNLLHAEENQMTENHSLQCVDSKSKLLSLVKPSITSHEEQLIKANSPVDSKIKSELMTSDNIGIKNELTLSENLQPKYEPMEYSLLKIQDKEMECHSLECNRPASTAVLIKPEDNDIKKEGDEKRTAAYLFGKSSNENNERYSTDMLPNKSSIKVIKQALNFHEQRVVRVLLRRLEDEDIFRLWKEEGVVSMLKHSNSKSTMNGKQAQSSNNNIQKSLRKKKNSYKCFACKVSFKNRERYWEHRASKCDKVRVFGCGNCNRKYILKRMLDEHKEKCNSIKYFRCKVCLKLFYSQERLDEHYASKCDTQKVFKCDECDRSFIFKRLLLIHKTPVCSSLNLRCSICNQSIERTQMKSHIIKEHGENLLKELSNTLCEFCGKLVSHKHFSDHIKNHYVESHYGSLYQCRFCRKVFQTDYARQYHERYHPDVRPCFCADCGKGFIRISDLKKHVYSSGNPNKCNTCGKIFHNLFCYRAHLKSHVKVENCGEENLMPTIKHEPCDLEVSPLNTDEIPAQRDFICKMCGKSFLRRDNLSRHVTVVHKPKFPKPVDTTPPNLFCYRAHLKSHVKVENCGEENLMPTIKHEPCDSEVSPLNTDEIPAQRDFICKMCGKSFLRRDNLSRHVTIVHKPRFPKPVDTTPTEEKPYACHICGACFSCSLYLNKHHKRMHRVKSDNPLYFCSFCDEKFNTDAQLKEHTFEHLKNCITVPTSDREEETLFGNSEVNMRNSNDNPAPEKPLTCEICGSSFGNKRNLNRHHNRMHSKSSLNPSSWNNEKSQSDSNLTHDINNLENEISINHVVKEEGNLFAVTVVKEEEEDLFLDSNFKQPEEASASSDIKNEGQIIPDELTQDCTKSVHLGSELSNLHNLPPKVKICEECGKTFDTKYRKSRHVCLHKLNTLQSTMGRNVHTCEECGVFFLDERRLKKHLLSHNPTPLKCNVCKKCFTTESKLNFHMIVHEVKATAEPNFQCSTCNKLFPSSKKLEDHLVFHTEQHPYQCRKCNRKFSCAYSLKRHNDNAHSDKRFLCNYCQMSFVSFSSLNKHVTVVHKKTISLTEYVLKIDDDEDYVQDQTPVEVEIPSVSNLQNHGTAEVNLQPHVFTTISKLFMQSNLFSEASFQSGKQAEHTPDFVNTYGNIPGIPEEKEASSPLEATAQFANTIR